MRVALLAVGLISSVVNLLYLTGSLFMLEIYDRVLPSRNVPTLVGLACPTSAPMRQILRVDEGKISSSS